MTALNKLVFKRILKLKGVRVKKIDEWSTQGDIDKFNSSLDKFVQIGNKLKVNELTAFDIFASESVCRNHNVGVEFYCQIKTIKPTMNKAKSMFEICK